MTQQETNKNDILSDCAKACDKNNVPCPFVECKHWIKYEGDKNCDLISVYKNGEMTFRQIGERLGISYVRVKQIETAAIKKLKKLNPNHALED